MNPLSDSQSLAPGRRIWLLALLLLGTATAHLPQEFRDREQKLTPTAIGYRATQETKWRVPLGLEPLGRRDSTHAYDIRHYRLDLALPMNNGSFVGRARITVTSRAEHLDSVTLHMVNLVCDSVRRDDNPLSFTNPAGLLVIRLDRSFEPGESLFLDVYYHRNSGVANRGFLWYSRAQTGFHVLAYTMSEPEDARYWFPGFDEPYDKAEQGCMLNITVPETLSVCANGLLDSVTSQPGAGTKTYYWRHGYPIATYLMHFAASRWASFKQWFSTGPGESAYVQNFVWPEDSVRARTAFQNTVDMMNFFSAPDRYGRYPFEKYGMVEAYPFAWGGMEHQTMTTVHHYWVEYGSDNGIAHELSHMWWGDMVTCQDWREIWLNEGFATYSDALYDYHQNGRSAFLQRMNSRAQDYFDEDAQQRHPLYNPGLNNLFDWGHSYCKGSWVQHMLRSLLGDTLWSAPGVFFEALRAYGDSLRYNTATTQDYRRIFEQQTGLDLGWFFDEWIYQAGYPNYAINWNYLPSGPNYLVNIQIAQNNGAQAPTCFHMPLQIAIRLGARDSLVVIPITSNPQTAQFLVSAAPTTLVVDPGSWLLDKATLYVGVTDATAPELAAPLAANPSRVRQGTDIRYTVRQPGRFELAIHDYSGRHVRTLAGGTASPGTSYVRWNGQDERGRVVAPGVYFCRLSQAGQNWLVKLVLVP